MARRRMFTLELVSSDRFLALEPTAQSFYFHLGMHADDEGFVAAPNSLALLCKCSQADLKALEDSGYIIRFSSGVIVLVDWMINNTIRKDRSMETMHKAEKAMLKLVDGKYMLKDGTEDTSPLSADLATNLATKNDIFFSDKSAPQNRIEQNRIEKNRIDQIISDQSTGSQADRRAEDETPYDEKKAPSLLDIFRYVLDNKLRNVDPSSFWNYYEARNWCDDLGAPIRDWHALIRKWDLTTPPLT